MWQLNPYARDLWHAFAVGLPLTIFIETLVLLAALDPKHGLRAKLSAGLWLTACTYPFVVLVLPFAIDPVAQRAQYLLVAETFAPIVECALFRAAFPGATLRDMAAIVGANLISFGAGMILG